jgi:hypothetical protein
LADEDRSTLVDAGATHIATTLIETRDQLRTLAVHERQRSAVSPDSPVSLHSSTLTQEPTRG